LSVLKVRGSPHGKEISRFEITEKGMEVGTPIRAASGMLTGSPMLSGECLLQEATGLPAALLESIFQDLKQQGLVLQSDEGGVAHYRATL
jgi:hypothetical protein